MTSSYELIKRCAREKRLNIDIGEATRIRGTLRVAGFPDMLAPEDVDAARAVVVEQLKPKPARRKVRTANAEEIEARKFLATKGVCPRCKVAMATAKLTDYSNALVCPSCKATLWE